MSVCDSLFSCFLFYFESGRFIRLIVFCCLLTCFPSAPCLVLLSESPLVPCYIIPHGYVLPHSASPETLSFWSACSCLATVLFNFCCILCTFAAFFLLSTFSSCSVFYLLGSPYLLSFCPYPACHTAEP